MFIKTRSEILNNKVEGKRDRIRSVVLGWFRASYPFASLFLSVAKEGSSVFFQLMALFSETYRYRLLILTVWYVLDWQL
jgi:hypothetical protein